jgi:hypothetical protein
MRATLVAPFSATTVRFVGGRTVLHDGPFIPEPEAVGGFGIIEVADLDEALALARSWPVGGYVEIRPLVTSSSRAAVVSYPHHTTQRGQCGPTLTPHHRPQQCVVAVQARQTKEDGGAE